MRTNQNRFTCRVLFLLVCIVPTLLQVANWLNAAGKRNQPRVQRNELAEAEGDKSNSSSDRIRPNSFPESTRKKSSLVSTSIWSDLESTAGSRLRQKVSQVIEFKAGSIDHNHPLFLLRTGQPTIEIRSDRAILLAKDVTLNLDDLLANARGLRLIEWLRKHEIERCSIRQVNLMPSADTSRMTADNATINFQLTGVEIDLQPPVADSIQLRGVYRQLDGELSEFMLSADSEAMTWGWEGAQIPAWICPTIASWTGVRAMLTGKWAGSRSSSNHQTFQGKLEHADCTQIVGQVLPSLNKPPITGLLHAIVQKSRWQDGRLVEFAGELTSASRGTVRQTLAVTIPGVEWLPNFETIEYQSFYARVSLDGGNLDLKPDPRFQGQLIWGPQVPIVISTSWKDFWVSSYEYSSREQHSTSNYQKPFPLDSFSKQIPERPKQ